MTKVQIFENVDGHIFIFTHIRTSVSSQKSVHSTFIIQNDQSADSREFLSSCIYIHTHPRLVFCSGVSSLPYSSHQMTKDGFMRSLVVICLYTHKSAPQFLLKVNALQYSSHKMTKVRICENSYDHIFIFTHIRTLFSARKSVPSHIHPSKWLKCRFMRIFIIIYI